MGYKIIYKNKKRNWIQKTLDDYGILDKIKFNSYLDAIEDQLWKQKKDYYYKLKNSSIKNLSPLRRGRPKKRYATKEIFKMDMPRDTAEVNKFQWFSRLWKRKRNCKEIKIESRYDFIEIIEKFHPQILNRFDNLKEKVIIPKFRKPKIVLKEDFCDNMSDWAWEAAQYPSKEPGFACHVFYLNDFSIIDDIFFSLNISWPKKSLLPSDLIKYELFRLLEGYSTYTDYFRTLDLINGIQNHLAINMTHNLPSANSFTSKIRKIGLEPIKEFFKYLVDEARSLGLIKDRIHIWDGQFHETWIKKDKKRREGLDQFFGGTYNHGGKKVGIGIYQSTIMDWNGTCSIPIHTEVIEANRNENPVLRDTVNNAYKNNKKPKVFLADRGPSGIKTQTCIINKNIRPIIPLTSKSTKNVRITKNKELRFLKDFTDDISDETLEILYNKRTRIEEHYNLNDTVYNSARLHCSGKLMIDIEVYLLNILGVLIPLTAYKLGRPDLMWSPSKFRHLKIEPSSIFPLHFNEIEKKRWDETIPTKDSYFFKKRVYKF